MPSAGIFGSARVASGPSLPAPFFHIDAGNASSYPGSGSTWNDISVTGRVGTLSGDYAYQAGDAGGAMDFGGVTSYAGFASDAALNLSSAFTVSIWMKPQTTKEAAILEKGYASSGWMVWYYPGDLKWYVGGSPYVSYTPTLNTWVHVVYTHDGSRLKMYANGTQIHDIAFTTFGSSGNSAPLNVGRYATEEYDGRLTEVRFYSSALTSTEVGALFTATRTRHGI